MKDFFKTLFKNFFDTSIIRKILSCIFYLYIYMVYKTSKIIIKGHYNDIINYINSGNGIILFTWHGRLLITPIVLKKLFKEKIKNSTNIVVLSSAHRDGKIASSIAQMFGIKIIEGSTIDPKKGSSKNKKSLTSIRNMMRSLQDGDICALAVDGPRGPAFKMNTKLTEIAQKTNTAVVCISVSYQNKKILKTWDHFNFAFPFGKIVIDYGKITTINKDQNIQEINNLLEKELNQMTEKNDKF